jgi:hypothetical protein
MCWRVIFTPRHKRARQRVECAVFSGAVGGTVLAGGGNARGVRNVSESGAEAHALHVLARYFYTAA